MNVYLTTLGTWAVRFWVLDTVVMTVLPSTILVPCPACLLWWATLCFEWLADEVDGSCYQATNNRNSIEISLNDWINEHACSLIFHDVFKIQWNYQNANKFSKILFFFFIIFYLQIFQPPLVPAFAFEQNGCAWFELEIVCCWAFLGSFL